MHDDLNLDVLLPVAEAIASAGTDEERAGVLGYLGLQAAVIANRIVDEDVRARWFRGPVGSALAALAVEPGRSLTRHEHADPAATVDDHDVELLRLVVEGLSNDEIAARLGVEANEVTRRLAATYARIGASSRADATAFAFQSRIL